MENMLYEASSSHHRHIHTGLYSLSLDHGKLRVIPVCPFPCAENLWDFALAETLKLKILLLFLS